MLTQTTGIDLLLKAIDVSLDRRKLILAVLGLVAAGVSGGVFFGLATFLDNEAAAALMALLGLMAMWIVATLFTGAIARMSYETLAGRPTSNMRAALSYAAGHLKSLLFAPLLLWGVLVAVLIAEAVILLLGRIPAVGPILAALLFLPLVLINALLLIFLLLGGWLVPAIVAGEGTGPVETLRRLRDLMRRAPGRLVTYLAVTALIMMIFGLALFIVMSIAASQTQALTLAVALDIPVPALSGSLGPGLLDDLLLFGLGWPRGVLVVAGVVYLLAWLVLMAIMVAVPWFIFPLASACAAHISVTGGAPAAVPAAQPVPAPGPAPAPAAQPTPTPQAPAATRFCNQCGGPLRPGASFCGQCGARIP